ncbi:MAG: hypothetical protein WCW68_01535 [Methanothrix sp.]|jgi:hypothetical protein
MSLTSRLSLHKPDGVAELFGDYFPTVYAADLQQIDDNVQIKNSDAAGHIPVYNAFGILVDSEIAPEDLEIGLIDSILPNQGMLLYKGASDLSALVPDTAGKSLMTQGPDANPVFGYPAHSTLTGLTTGDPHTQYHNDGRGDARYAPIDEGVTGGDDHTHAPEDTVFAATGKVLARKTASGGVGEECSLSDILDFIGSASRGDILYRGASEWLRLGKGASGQRLVQGVGDPAWVTTPFYAPFIFGDGGSVLVAGSCSYPIPVACKITAARIRSYDAAGAPLSGSITCKLYDHAIDAAIGTLVDTFAIASDTDMTETGLNIAVPAGTWLTIVTSGITSCKLISCVLQLEPT